MDFFFNFSRSEVDMQEEFEALKNKTKKTKTLTHFNRIILYANSSASKQSLAIQRALFSHSGVCVCLFFFQVCQCDGLNGWWCIAEDTLQIWLGSIRWGILVSVGYLLWCRICKCPCDAITVHALAYAGSRVEPTFVFVCWWTKCNAMYLCVFGFAETSSELGWTVGSSIWSNGEWIQQWQWVNLQIRQTCFLTGLRGVVRWWCRTVQKTVCLEIQV